MATTTGNWGRLMLKTSDAMMERKYSFVLQALVAPSARFRIDPVSLTIRRWLRPDKLIPWHMVRDARIVLLPDFHVVQLGTGKVLKLRIWTRDGQIHDIRTDFSSAQMVYHQVHRDPSFVSTLPEDRRNGLVRTPF